MRAAGGGGAGEGNLVDAGVGHQVGADVTSAGHDVENTGRQARGQGRFRHQEGVEDRLLCRLEHHGASGCQGGCDLQERDALRDVPRHDRTDDAHRLTRHQGGAAEHALALLFDRCAVHHVAVVAQQQRRKARLELLSQPDRHAVLHRHPCRGLGAPRLQLRGEQFERFTALLGMPGCPSLGVVERGPGGGHRGVDVGIAAARDRTDQLFGGGGMHVDRGCRRGVRPRTSEVELAVVDRWHRVSSWLVTR